MYRHPLVFSVRVCGIFLLANILIHQQDIVHCYGVQEVYPSAEGAHDAQSTITVTHETTSIARKRSYVH